MSDEIVGGSTGTPQMRVGERVRYVPNHRSFGAFIKSDQMRAAVVEVATVIAAAAAGHTPPSSGGEDSTGLHDEVKGGFKVKPNAGLLEVGGNRRVVVEVTNDVRGSALVEFGARGLTRVRMLGRAGAENGDFKPDGGPA